MRARRYSFVIADRQTGAVGALPDQKGTLRGLIKVAFGPPGVNRSWCPGAYTGTVKVRGHVVGSFTFSVL